MLEPFPADWRTALVLVPHPDDPEYGCAAAVAKWTREGRTVHYALASRGEAGIAGMPPEQAGPLREREQLRSAAVVGVADVQFWDFPDSDIRNTAELRAAITTAITALRPDVVISIYGGPEWAPGAPNQRDHMEFAAAVLDAYDSLAEPPRWLFQNGPEVTHAEVIDDGCFERAVASLAEHKVYLSVLDPDTPVVDQARRQVDMTTTPRPEFDGRRTVEFILKRTSR
ncbi:N-acetylglucosaminyl deacetylase, LmbE family [Mycolicibacterium rutilum]|uniref:N-acetylglucosaminyl deacetylase, LmbE family n=1 Tax=Mycolicibacterium rutilum TaxID=370526 RepID=A0A1H6LTT8_MYCRU|nr:PIG-L family deacetylase [Mycolicibacterium rutilum]SEH89856.1 N-acetylglucosaminyl deacetylase, LmbE family [Mycolicibacterium rutilum]